jgi:hypothetical protein
MKLNLPELDYSVERQLADHDVQVEELQDTGTVGGVIIAAPAAAPDPEVFEYLWQSESPAQTGTHDRFYPGRSGTIISVKPYVTKGDGISVVTLDVLKNGSTIYPSASKPNVSAGNFLTGNFLPDTTSFASGDYLQINVISNGGTIGTIRLAIEFEEA